MGNSDASSHQLKLQNKVTYVYPSGYKVELDRPSAGRRWRLVGTQAEGTFCHKPAPFQVAENRRFPNRLPMQ